MCTRRVRRRRRELSRKNRDERRNQDALFKYRNQRAVRTNDV